MVRGWNMTRERWVWAAFAVVAAAAVVAVAFSLVGEWA